MKAHVIALLAIAACKDSSSTVAKAVEPAPATPAPSKAPTPAPTPAAPRLGPGEALFAFSVDPGDKGTAFANPFPWKAQSVAITCHASADINNDWLRITVDGVEVVKGDFNSAYSHLGAFKPQSDGRLAVIIQNNGGSGDSGERTAYLLSSSDGKVKVDDKWQRPGHDVDAKPPAWADVPLQNLDCKSGG